MGGCGHFVERDRGNPRRRAAEDVQARNGLEEPNLMGDIRHTVALEDKPRLELRLGLNQFGFRDPVVAHSLDLSEERSDGVAILTIRNIGPLINTIYQRVQTALT